MVPSIHPSIHLLVRWWRLSSSKFDLDGPFFPSTDEPIHVVETSVSFSQLSRSRGPLPCGWNKKTKNRKQASLFFFSLLFFFFLYVGVEEPGRNDDVEAVRTTRRQKKKKKTRRRKTRDRKP